MKNVLCFGDSLTAGYSNNGKNFFPYSERLSKLLGNRYNVDFIGIIGALVDEILHNIDNEINDINGKIWPGLRQQLKTKKYEYCVLLMGSNDLCDYNVESLTKDIFKIYELILDMNVKLIALTIPRLIFEETDTEMREVRENINKNIVSMSTKNKNIKIVDIAKLINDNSMYDTDGLHFNKKGYDQIADLIYKIINN